MNPSTCVDKLKILADPTRLGVLQQLQTGPQTVGSLGIALGVEQSLLSHHLRVLRDAAFVLAQRDGKCVVYRLAPDVIADPRGLDLDCCVLSFR